MISPERPIERPAWLTYAQAGERLGLSPEAVRHRARRSGWRTMPGNDGRTLVMVPGDIEAQPVRTPVQTPDRTADHTPDHGDDIARAHARAEQADTDRRAAEQRADAALALANQTLEHLSRAEQAIGAERARADALRDRVDSLQAQITALETEGAASDVETAELTAQLKQARSDLRAERTHGEELRTALAEIEGRPWWRRWKRR